MGDENLKKTKGKHEAKHKSKSRGLLFFILIIFFIALMIFSGIKIFKWLEENKKSDDIAKEISKAVVIDEKKEEKKYNIDFKALKKTNTETVGWLKVYGTKIEYPVVKTTDNDYYISHSFDKSYNSVGWVFADYRNKIDGTDKNIVIYAHNRRDGSMFGTLKNILTENWQNNQENLTIPFITEKDETEYKVFSVYRVEKEDYYINTNFNNDTEFKLFIDTVKSRSMKDFGVEVSEKDQILTLSTCADNNKYRVVLHAKKI